MQLNRRDYLYEAGVYQDPIETVYSGVIPWSFGNKFALAWWDERRMTLGSDHVREYIDLELQEMEKPSQALVFGNIKKTGHEFFLRKTYYL